MISIIAEKPSVAKQISRVVGAMIKKKGYYGGNGYGFCGQCKNGARQ